jgi:NhaP-type Na+/H+ or K+/H+ antiporter
LSALAFLRAVRRAFLRSSFPNFFVFAMNAFLFLLLGLSFPELFLCPARLPEASS